MDRIDAMIADILRREGGYVDHPGDKGGPTNHGISLKYAIGVGLDVDGDGDVDNRDIFAVTPEQAASLYRTDFYLYPHIHRLPESVQPIAFDMAVNHGPPRAIMLIQKVVNQVADAATDLGIKRIEEDGVIGPQTVKAVQAVYDAMGEFFINAIVDARAAFYRQIVRRDPSQEVFLAGWLKRNMEFRA